VLDKKKAGSARQWNSAGVKEDCGKQVTWMKPSMSCMGTSLHVNEGAMHVWTCTLDSSGNEKRCMQEQGGAVRYRM
jgi:hypothetical protein